MKEEKQPIYQCPKCGSEDLNYEGDDQDAFYNEHYECIRCPTRWSNYFIKTIIKPALSQCPKCGSSDIHINDNDENEIGLVKEVWECDNCPATWNSQYWKIFIETIVH